MAPSGISFRYIYLLGSVSQRKQQYVGKKLYTSKLRDSDINNLVFLQPIRPTVIMMMTKLFPCVITEYILKQLTATDGLKTIGNRNYKKKKKNFLGSMVCKSAVPVGFFTPASVLRTCFSPASLVYKSKAVISFS